MYLKHPSQTYSRFVFFSFSFSCRFLESLEIVPRSGEMEVPVFPDMVVRIEAGLRFEEGRAEVEAMVEAEFVDSSSMG